MKEPWPILTEHEMRQAEEAIFASGVAHYALMERAGLAAAEIIWRVGHLHPVLVLCGPGNNGGDGYVIARALREKGVPVRVAALAEPTTESARQAKADWLAAGGSAAEDVMTCAPSHQIVDALFGIGLTRGLAPELASRLNELVGHAARSYAIDVPSGIATDSGVELSPVPRFSHCIALGALKPAHVLRPGALKAGRTILCDIGIDPAAARMLCVARPVIPAPADDAHKYTRGLVAVVAGPMAGAAALAANAAAHGGAGYVRMVGAQAIVHLPHAIVRASARDDGALGDGRIACVIVGPGLGRGDAAREPLVNTLAGQRAAVVDADGLLALDDFALLPAQSILTPHEGEFSAVFGALAGTAIDRARTAAERANAVVVLKGAPTIIAAPDGRIRVSDHAPSWLSTAGTGDVLAGLCGARLAVTADAFRAASEAVWLHGEAARLAGPAFIADDLATHIPAAIAGCR